tara:strand:- start:5735 stop:6187 length:453 start_codon:yes stop_codon:yes gene_type:complete
MSANKHNTVLRAEIWGPHYWFVLYTIAISYPNNPNQTTKKKYYDFIQNLPIFLPDQEIGNIFLEFLDNYPVTPYLDSRESFIKWVHFIHNKINIYLGKSEMTYYDAMNNYYENYKETNIKRDQERRNHGKYIFYTIIIILIIVIITLVNK